MEDVDFGLVEEAVHREQKECPRSGAQSHIPRISGTEEDHSGKPIAGKQSAHRHVPAPRLGKMTMQSPTADQSGNDSDKGASEDSGSQGSVPEVGLQLIIDDSHEGDRDDGAEGRNSV